MKVFFVSILVILLGVMVCTFGIVASIDGHTILGVALIVLSVLFASLGATLLVWDMGRKH